MNVESFHGTESYADKKPFGIISVAFQEKAGDNMLQVESHMDELRFLDK